MTSIEPLAQSVPTPVTANAATAKKTNNKKPAIKPTAKTAVVKTAATKTGVSTTKSSSRAITKPSAQTGVKAAGQIGIQSSEIQITKPKKPKMVRDSFTIPKPEYDVLNVLKLRAAKLGNPVKKTELIRAGVKAIALLSDAAFKQAILAVPSLKTGRPAKAKKA